MMAYVKMASIFNGVCMCLAFIFTCSARVNAWAIADECKANNTTKPQAVDDWPDVPISSFEIICTFNGTCEEFRGSVTPGYMWIELGRETTTSGTGPTHFNDCYIYAEASLGDANDQVFLKSRRIIAEFETYCLDFKYHMHGEDIGNLSVSCTGDDSPIFHKSDNQGRSWIRETMNLAIELYSEFSIIFTATRGKGSRGDIALDDIYLLHGDCKRGQWGTWSSWTCSCGQGNRYRECLSEPCNGYYRDLRLCSDPFCTANGWTTWSQWACMVTCGTGRKARSRVCIENRCPGNPRETVQCQLPACPDIWGPWSRWRCSVSCGIGLEDRNRTCQGNDCIGRSKEARLCRLPKCLGVWSAWSQWKCDTSCGFGKRRRKRTCSPSSAICIGDASDIDICESPVPCPDDATL